MINGICLLIATGLDWRAGALVAVDNTSDRRSGDSGLTPGLLRVCVVIGLPLWFRA